MVTKQRIILGIDPGSRSTGVGLLQQSGQHITCLHFEHIQASDAQLSKRLYIIHTRIAELIQQYQPDEAAIEQVFTYHNPQSALKLGQARGVALLAASHLRIAEYSARAVKKAVVGYGNAAKDQVQHMMRALLKLTQTPQSDAADALAIAWCHANHCPQLANIKEC